MALINCPDCGTEVSDIAPACLKCGRPLAVTISQPSPTLNKRRTHPVTWLVLVAIVLGAVFTIWRSVNSDKAPPLTAGLQNVMRQPLVVVNEKVEINEGQSMLYSFQLTSDARVQVKVTASPKRIDVMLMTRAQADKYREISGRLFGGEYTYRQSLSSQNILRMDQTEMLPAGDWTIVVLRPAEALLFHENTTADVNVTVY